MPKRKYKLFVNAHFDVLILRDELSYNFVKAKSVSSLM